MDDDTLESKLKSKLKSGEINEEEYNNLYNKFQELGILSKTSSSHKSQHEYSKTGSTKLEGGKINRSLTVSGRTLVDGPLECNRLTVQGSAEIDGDLTVLGKTSISGSIVVNGNAKMSDQTAVSGSMEVTRNVYSFVKYSLAGRAKIEGSLNAEGPVIISGNFRGKELKSVSSVKFQGDIWIQDDLLADDFECQSGVVKIGGNLKANNIRIFARYREIPSMELDQSKDIGDMISNVVNVIFPSILNTFKNALDTVPSIFTIEGNVEGKIVDLSYTKVKGDIIADRVYIGPNVVVKGIVRYRSYIETPKGTKYTIEKIPE